MKQNILLVFYYVKYEIEYQIFIINQLYIIKQLVPERNLLVMRSLDTSYLHQAIRSLFL